MIALPPDPAGADWPLSVVIFPEAQPHPGYMLTHAASADEKAAAAEVAMPMASSVPQQSVWCRPTVHSLTLEQVLLKAGNSGGVAVQSTPAS
jgi:hypothetical protein